MEPAESLYDESTLLKDMIKGDTDAFRRIYEHYYGAIYNFAFRLTKTKELTEDVVQDVFVKLWEKKADINIEYNFGAYIRQVTRNHIYNIWKRAATDKAVLQKIHAGLQELQLLTPEELLEKELARLHREAVDRLSPRQKEIYLMRREEELSFDQIAEKLGISRNTVKNHMVEALQHIRKDISGQADLACIVLAICLYQG